MPTELGTVIHRREALRRAACLLGTAISAPTIEAVLAGCQARQAAEASGASPTATVALKTLSPEQRDMVLTMGEHILPETDTPGARGRVH